MRIEICSRKTENRNTTFIIWQGDFPFFPRTDDWLTVHEGWAMAQVVDSYFDVYRQIGVIKIGSRYNRRILGKSKRTRLCKMRIDHIAEAMRRKNNVK